MISYLLNTTRFYQQMSEQRLFRLEKNSSSVTENLNWYQVLNFDSETFSTSDKKLIPVPVFRIGLRSWPLEQGSQTHDPTFHSTSYKFVMKSSLSRSWPSALLRRNIWFPSWHWHWHQRLSPCRRPQNVVKPRFLFERPKEDFMSGTEWLRRSGRMNKLCFREKTGGKSKGRSRLSDVHLQTRLRVSNYNLSQSNVDQLSEKKKRSQVSGSKKRQIWL